MYACDRQQDATLPKRSLPKSAAIARGLELVAGMDSAQLDDVQAAVDQSRARRAAAVPQAVAD
jgi:hypothetical protein